MTVRSLIVRSAIIGLVLLSGCGRLSCYELQFARHELDPKWFIRVDVTPGDEKNHPAFAWIAEEVTHGTESGTRRGKWLVEDLWAISREHNVDPSAVIQPLFIVRGTPLLVKPLNHCLLF
jgi:hypothetical protein